VLVERGTCRLRSKVARAARAGASAAIVFNDGRPGRRGTFPGSLVAPGARIPALAASYATGRRLARSAGRRVAVRVRAVSERRTTQNVIADLPVRSGPRVVVAGAHLDSVPDGPGINDNGSGVAALLDSAETLAREGETPRHGFRVAFWGAEEAGLLGSRQYVRRLSAAQRERIHSYLNLDMVGSSNAGRFVYSSPDGQALEAVARRALERRGVPARQRGLGGNSDHGPFDRAGIPVVGFFSGALARKDRAERALWGGRAGVSFDRCYHRRCDRLKTINRKALAELGGAATDTLRELRR
jgi:Zn-dependent M28 family amino/carboxypeptidase